ncbi:uncharacterized protein [Cicer arietinum]|uniref:peptidylprolyl isomerase n=1 Tax=Cicer arietinum TaxID=3827 RepID=A0A1S2YNC1_CICAR|nr:uncharacterized protein LOC101506458 [Cicer arietinum]
MTMITSNSITLGGVASFTTRNFCYGHMYLSNPNAKLRGPTFSLSFSRGKSLDIFSSPTATTIPTLRHLNTPISAVNSGLEASITDPNDISDFLTDATVVAEAEDEDKIQLRVELNGDQTEKVFDRILINLGRTTPPVPGFRVQKGGKSSKIPKSFLLQMLGEERVTKFAIQEILNCTMADYVKKENLDVKDRKVNTVQTVGELKQSFTPGKEFVFNVLIEPENS